MLTDEQRQLAADHMWLARQQAAISHSKRPGMLDYDDLLSDACLGLIHAAGHYDPASEASFKTFAFHRVRGAIADGMRDRDSLGRLDRQRCVAMERARDRFAAREHRFPDAHELATEHNVTVARVHELRTRRARATPVYHTPEHVARFGDEYMPPAELVRDDGAERDLAMVLARNTPIPIHRLAERERLVIALRYWEGCTLREIGDVLGVTDSRVSQILSKALNQLRTMVPRDLALAA
jgi:RNA polymerase sigma factor FliA